MYRNFSPYVINLNGLPGDALQSLSNGKVIVQVHIDAYILPINENHYPVHDYLLQVAPRSLQSAWLCKLDQFSMSFESWVNTLQVQLVPNFTELTRVLETCLSTARFKYPQDRNAAWDAVQYLNEP